MSGVAAFGLLLFGVVLEFGFEVLFGFDEFISELLELLGDVELLLGEVEELELLEGELLVLDGDVGFMSVLLDPVVDDGEVELLDPAGVDVLDGLCEL